MNTRPPGNRRSPDNASAHKNRAGENSLALRFCNFVDNYAADFLTGLSRRPEASYHAAHHKKKTEQVKYPILAAFKHYPRTLTACVGARFVEGIAFNVFGVFSLTYLTNSCGLDKTVSLFVIVGAAAVMAVAIPFWGMRADTWGRARIFGIAAILLGITAYPTFWVLHNFSHNVLLVFLAISLPFGIIYGAAYATMSSLFSGSFEPTVRYSAVSFIYQFSGIFASGLTPMIATMLVSSNDGQPWYLCGYLLVAAVISSLSTIWITRLQGKEELPHEPETSAR